MLEKISDLVLACPELQEWPELRSILNKAKPGTISFFDIAYSTMGNTEIDSNPIRGAILCFLVQCILIDDILDEDEKGAWKDLGAGRTANLASALQARQHFLVYESKFSDQQKQETSFCLGQMNLKIAHVQELATQNKVNEDLYWKIVHGKSGNICGSSMKMGAILGEASSQELEILYSIGKHMGEIGQISNDLRGAFQKQVNPDWNMPGSSLPILLALTAEHEYLDELKELMSQDLSQEGRLERAQDLLIKSGAVSRCCDHISQRLLLVHQKLDESRVPKKEHLYENIGEDLKHAIQWLRNLGIDLSQKTKQAMRDIEDQLK